MYNTKMYGKEAFITKLALDKIDIKSFLCYHTEIHELMKKLQHEIEIAYLYNDKDNKTYNAWCFMKNYPDIFANPAVELFHHMTIDDFLYYCKKRYPNIKWNCKKQYWID